mmetsp:Transcript_34487/g.98020  ORF Transcript_34487/g.98020 Transcript_34487/m.98020 type:complete len:110 (+) Transcript_34487:1667-1996(+)
MLPPEELILVTLILSSSLIPLVTLTHTFIVLVERDELERKECQFCCLEEINSVTLSASKEILDMDSNSTWRDLPPWRRLCVRLQKHLRLPAVVSRTRPRSTLRMQQRLF